MKKGFLTLTAAGLGTALFLTACGHIGNITPDSKVKLDPNKPVSLTVWHYYNGAQQDEFNRLVREFNKTVGKEKGIVVEGSGQGTISELEANVLDAIQGKAGADQMPNMFAAYGDAAYEVDQLGYAVDLKPYFTEEELSKYVEGYITEGNFSGEDSLKIFPVAKSVELLMLNKTDWEKIFLFSRCDNKKN